MKEVDLHEILHVYGEQRQQDVERRQGENRLGGILRNVRRPRINWKGVANVDPEVAPSSASSLVISGKTSTQK